MSHPICASCFDRFYDAVKAAACNTTRAKCRQLTRLCRLPNEVMQTKLVTGPVLIVRLENVPLMVQPHMLTLPTSTGGFAIDIYI